MKITKQKALQDLEAVCLCAANQELIKMPADIYRRLGENDENENMVSNLPLLFAGGYPTSLDKITESQLEKFIPFMVQCSLGDIQAPVLDSSSEPEWWPEDVPFTIPLRRPNNCHTDEWFNKLKEIVAICYQFHKSVFLLRFCENLSAYQTESLRFISNFNSTTSLFDRVSNKLLVTFRNENMLYDQQRANKKTLMPKMHSAQPGEPHQMVEQSLFDIYLCDNCEAELYSYDAYQEHEKTCHSVAFESDDDDVIFCGEEKDEATDTTLQQNTFLQQFQLCKRPSIHDEDVKPFKMLSPHKRISQTMSFGGCTSSFNNNNNTIFSGKNGCGKGLDAVDDAKVRRVHRRAPGVNVLLKSSIPITSPAGQRLIAQSNATITDEYARERIERYERFCTAPPLAPDSSNRPKFMDKKPILHSTTTFRTNNKHYHCYKFPRRQFSTKRRNDQVAQLERIQLSQSKCKPVRITVQRLSNKEIETLKTQVKVSQVKRRKISHKLVRQNDIDVIDLCSSDAESDDESTSEISHGTSETSSSETKSSSHQSHTVRPTHNTLLFVDCSLPAEHLYGGSIETIVDPSLQLTTATRSQYDSTANVPVRKPKPPSKLYAATHARVDYQQIQQDKENRIFSYISSQQSHNPQSAAYIYGDDDLDIDGPIVPAAHQTTNFISIDLTL